MSPSGGGAEGHAPDQVEESLASQVQDAQEISRELRRSVRNLGFDVAEEPSSVETDPPPEATQGLASLWAATQAKLVKAALSEGRPSVVKVTVNLPADMAESLRDLARREDKTFTQALKEAITLKLFISDVIEQGAKLLIEHRDKTVERIVFGLSPPPRK